VVEGQVNLLDWSEDQYYRADKDGVEGCLSSISTRLNLLRSRKSKVLALLEEENRANL